MLCRTPAGLPQFRRLRFIQAPSLQTMVVNTEDIKSSSSHPAGGTSSNTFAQDEPMQDLAIRQNPVALGRSALSAPTPPCFIYPGLPRSQPLRLRASQHQGALEFRRLVRVVRLAEAPSRQDPKVPAAAEIQALLGRLGRRCES